MANSILRENGQMGITEDRQRKICVKNFAFRLFYVEIEIDIILISKICHRHFKNPTSWLIKGLSQKA